LSRLRGRSLVDAAEQSVEISPATTWPGKPAIFLPGELDRIVGHASTSDPQSNLARLAGEPIRQGAANAHLLRNIVVADGSLLASGYHEAISSKRRRWRLPKRLAPIAEGAFCSTKMTEQYFGHWLTDGLAHELWAQDQSLTPLVLPSPPGRVHEPGYRVLTGMSARVIELALVDRLWLVEDHELSASRVGRLERLRQRVRQSIETNGPTHVFIRRGATAVGRSLVNEPEVIEALQRRGFAILSPETSEPNTIAKALANARVIVSVEGSAMAHAVMAAPAASTLVAIMPPSRTNCIFKSYADVLGMRYGLTVGEPLGEESFSQPIERLLHLLDLVEQSS